MQQKVREKLKNFKDYEEFLHHFESHKEKHDHRTKIMRNDGWGKLNDKFGDKFDKEYTWIDD